MDTAAQTEQTAAQLPPSCLADWRLFTNDFSWVSLSVPQVPSWLFIRSGVELFVALGARA